MTTKKERLRAAIAGDIVDRPPVALWRHFPVDDQDPIQLADRTLEFQQLYDWDFIKVTPASSFCLRDWGIEDEWRGHTEGTRDYTNQVIQGEGDWNSLSVLNPEDGALGEQLICLDHIQTTRKDDTPFIQTIFSPLAQAKNLAGMGELIASIHRHPQSVHTALEVITKTTIAFIDAAKRRGISGIFYALQHATYRFFDRAGYATFGEPYDRRILEAAEDLWLNVLHLHGDDIMFELASTYPIQVVNWHDRETPPSIDSGRSKVDGAVCGGLRRIETMVLGRPDLVRGEAQQALRATEGGRGHILGTGCVVPINAPRGNLISAREVVEEFSTG